MDMEELTEKKIWLEAKTGTEFIGTQGTRYGLDPHHIALTVRSYLGRNSGTT